MIQITMPRLSDTMEEGSILAWHKKPGDAVNVGDVLVEIETDKATMEYEAYEAGTLSKIIAAEGELVSIGAPIAELEGGEGDASAASKPDEDQEPEIESVGSEQHASERRFASPLVRKIAREHNLDLSEIRGTGPGGRVIRTDIEVLLEEGAASGRATEQQTPSALAPATAGSARTDQNRSLAPAGDKRDSEAVPLNQVRRVIARRLRGERA
jgi:pyruvate dehydrogenase E2 component (dihydrolipoamide acetyltransferase)